MNYFWLQGRFRGFSCSPFSVYLENLTCHHTKPLIPMHTQKKITLGRLVPILFLLLALMAGACSQNPPVTSPAEQVPWQEILEQKLHLLGHRNWILVVDKAFPEQSSSGMEYLYVDQDLPAVLGQVLEQVESSTHVSPVIYGDRELDYITEEQVPGIGAFREERGAVLKDREMKTLLHDEVFGLLDESASLFRVLVIKTSCALPYTSVFLHLDCAYWNGEQEKALRESMAADP